MREADRALPLRISVLARTPTEADALPEQLRGTPLLAELDVASVRLALALDDHRVYIGLAGPGDSLFLWSESNFGGAGGIGPRDTLVTHGARIQGSGTDKECEVVGIVSDEVNAVRVGSIDAVLANNVFIAVGAAFDDPIVLQTVSGERTVRRPDLSN